MLNTPLTLSLREPVSGSLIISPLQNASAPPSPCCIVSHTSLLSRLILIDILESLKPSDNRNSDAILPLSVNRMVSSLISLLGLSVCSVRVMDQALLSSCFLAASIKSALLVASSCAAFSETVASGAFAISWGFSESVFLTGSHCANDTSEHKNNTAMPADITDIMFIRFSMLVSPYVIDKKLILFVNIGPNYPLFFFGPV